MSDYEAAAYSTLERLKERHDAETQNLRAQFPISNMQKYTLPKEIMEMRGLERKFFALKNYEKA